MQYNRRRTDVQRHAGLTAGIRLMEARSLKIAICDDEKILREQLQKLLMNQDAVSKIDSIDAYETGSALLAAKRRYDIIFLDIQMEGMNGIETARALRERKDDAVLIFVTGLKDYVFEAFDVSAFRKYLKGPCPRPKRQSRKKTGKSSCSSVVKAAVSGWIRHRFFMWRAGRERYSFIPHGSPWKFMRR